MKVAIVCGSPTSEMLAPFDDKGWEIWVLGNRFDRYQNKRVTKIFEIHDDLTQHGDVKQYAQWLVDHKIPMIVGEKFPIKDKHVKEFCFKGARELIGQDYLTSSSAYMMAQAIMEGAEHIAVYGVDMAADDHEYFWQRPCMEGWIQFARGRGIKITIPEVASIAKCNYIEGRDFKPNQRLSDMGLNPAFAKPPFTTAAFKEVVDMHANKIAEYNAEIRKLEQMIHIHDGCRQAYERLVKVARAVESGVENVTLTGTLTIK